MAMEFEWDDSKAVQNARKHGVSFEEAVTAFADPKALTIYDQKHSGGEDRFHTIGMSQFTRILLVVHCDRDERIRLISACKATAEEHELYESQEE